MQAQPLICVRDVEASLSWYNTLLGSHCTSGGHGYARLFVDGRLLLQLHEWGMTHEHGPIGDPGLIPGNGVLLWFEVPDFEAAADRANRLDAQVVLPIHWNPRPGHWELWLRDPDGYTIVLASPDGTEMDHSAS